MKIANIFLALSLSFTAVVLMPQLAYAQAKCDLVFDPSLPQSRESVIDFVKKSKIPAVLIPTANGDIPAVLMNARTGSLMDNFLAQSIGTVVTYQPDWKNDHGLLRLDHIIADIDTPGARSRGELHKTGLSWVSLPGYLANGSNYVRIEVAYTLTEAEMQVARLYALMRRAAIVRVKFTFGGVTQKTDYPNFLNTGEHCFIYCSAGSLSSQIYEIKGRFQALGLGSLDEVLAKPDVQAWLQEVNQKLLTANVNSATELSPEVPSRVKAPASLASNPTFAAMDAAQKQETLNWIVGGGLSMDYYKLTNTLGFGSTGTGYNAMGNRRASAILIYDSKTSAANFTSPEYSLRGIFSSWSNKNSKPLQ